MKLIPSSKKEKKVLSSARIFKEMSDVFTSAFAIKH